MRFFALMLVVSSTLVVADDNILGFNESSSADQRALEASLDASIDTKEMDTWLRRMSAKPHHVGSVASRENAEARSSIAATSSRSRARKSAQASGMSEGASRADRPGRASALMWSRLTAFRRVLLGRSVARGSSSKIATNCRSAHSGEGQATSSRGDR